MQKVSQQAFYYVIRSIQVQWNPVYMDAKGTRQNVCVIGVSVLSGFPDKKSRAHVLSMKRPWQAFFTVIKCFNCTVTSFFCSCNRKA